MLDQIKSDDLDSTLVEISPEQVEMVSGGFLIGLLFGGHGHGHGHGHGGGHPTCPPPKPPPQPCKPKPPC